MDNLQSMGNQAMGGGQAGEQVRCRLSTAYQSKLTRSRLRPSRRRTISTKVRTAGSSSSHV